MNILEFVEEGGEVSTSSGHQVELILGDDEEYPLCGFVLDFGSAGFDYECKWNAEGLPQNLPNNHGLDLHPLIPKTVNRFVDRVKLNKYTSIYDFYENE